MPPSLPVKSSPSSFGSRSASMMKTAPGCCRCGAQLPYEAELVAAVRARRLAAEQGRRVDSQTVDAELQPEADHALELVAHLSVL